MGTGKEIEPNATPFVDPLEMWASDKHIITYRPELNKITGSVTATLLLQQIFFRWRHNGRTPFYKFFAPCDHDDYRDGDSWQEELGFSRRELTTALEKIGKRISKGISKTEALETNLVVYWTDSSRKTWFQLNETLLRQRLAGIYLYNGANVHYIEDAQNEHYIENDKTDNTFFTEITQRVPESSSNQDGPSTEIVPDNDNSNRTAWFSELLGEHGVIMGSAVQQDLWFELLAMTDNDRLIEATFRDISERGKVPTVKYARSIIQRCLQEGAMPGERQNGNGKVAVKATRKTDGTFKMPNMGGGN